MISVQVQQDGAVLGAQAVPTSGSITCPGLFYNTVAQDGALLRLRIPGGLLNATQCRCLVHLSESLGGSAVDVTNRANLQIRGLAAEDLQLRIARMAETLIENQLAAPLSLVDHLRNIMASPTAGIDPAQLIDTRPWVHALDAYISNEPGLAGLSPKFSVSLDGGERASIAQQPNDLRLTAVEIERQVYFQLDLGEIDPACRWLIRPEACVEAVAAVIQVYLLSVDPALARQPRLRQGLRPDLLQDALRPCSHPVHSDWHPARPIASPPEYWHLGIHPQRQPERFYMGVALPLGRLETDQLRQLADLAETYGSGTIRLTPWRNLLLPDITRADLPTVQQQLTKLGLSHDPIWGGLVACSGSTGCISSATDTQADALALALAFGETLGEASGASGAKREPLTIHFSGCPKSCAHRISSDLALVGDPEQATPCYSLYVGYVGASEAFGRLIATHLAPDELPAKVTNLLAAYGQHRLADQSFREFVVAQPLAQLQNWLAAGGLP